MFEVTEYEPPHIFVRSRRTGETYKFLVGNDGALVDRASSFDPGDARRAAIAYLIQKREAQGGSGEFIEQLSSPLLR
jgi:hypothetical protein